MRRPFPVPLAVMLALAACGEPPPHGMDLAELVTFRATTKAWSEAVMTADWGKLGTLYTADAVVLPPNHAAVKGRDSVVAWYANGPTVESLHREILEVDGHPGIAYVRGRYVMTTRAAGAHRAVTDSGKYVEIRHLSPDKRWLITIDMFSSNRSAR